MKITDIQTDIFNRLVEELQAEGWRKTEEYDGFDAWIDYGLIVLMKEGACLRCEWDNWMEGSLEGPDEVVQAIRGGHGLK
ncbi:MAG: hypothetical protein ACO1TE_17060 [Prosthecobacter sp.]